MGTPISRSRVLFMSLGQAKSMQSLQQRLLQVLQLQPISMEDSTSGRISMLCARPRLPGDYTPKIVSRISIGDVTLTWVHNAVKINKISPWFFFADIVAKYPTHRAIWTRQRTYTYAELREAAAQMAHWLLSQGLRPGEIVALYMTNTPEIMITWLACLCIGCAPAFVNFNLEDRGLLHCLDVANSKLLLVDEDEACQARIERSKEAILGRGTKIVIVDDGLRQAVASQKSAVPGDEYRLGVKPGSPLCLSYTRYVISCQPALFL